MIISPQMDSVLYILSHSEELQIKALPYVNVEKKEIDWYSIFQQDYDSGHYAALCWALSLWGDEATTVDPFDVASSMDARLRRIVLKAIAIRWTTPIDDLNTLYIA